MVQRDPGSFDPRSARVRRYFKSSVRKSQVHFDALQQPSTIVPTALTLLAAVYRATVSELIGGSTVAMVTLISSASIALIMYARNYVHGLRIEQSRAISEMENSTALADEASRRANITQIISTTRAGFVEIGFTRGVGALDGLTGVHHRLSALLVSDIGFVSTLDEIRSVSAETYRLGLETLQKTLQLAITVESPDKQRLEKELAEIELKIDEMRDLGADESIIEFRSATAASHRERLSKIGEQELKIERLLYECNRCEASLHRTEIDVSALKAQNAEASVARVTESLQRSVLDAKEVQEELKRLMNGE